MESMNVTFFPNERLSPKFLIEGEEYRAVYTVNTEENGAPAVFPAAHIEIHRYFKSNKLMYRISAEVANEIMNQVVQHEFGVK